MAEVETAVLAELHDAGEIADSDHLAQKLGLTHDALVPTIKSLDSYEMIHAKDLKHSRLVLTDEAKPFLSAGTPEAQLFSIIDADGSQLSELEARLPAGVAHLGFRQAMQRRWIKTEKGSKDLKVFRQVESIEDTVLQQLHDVNNGQAVDKATADALKKRRLVSPETWTTYRLTKGPKFALERKRQPTDLTTEMLQKGTWKDTAFKAYNFAALGLPTAGGHLHPLLKVRSQFRKIFTQMGFEEMPTNNYVENSFWNFDALFQPQQHPARDAHDTFFLTKPERTPIEKLPADYVERVRQTHERGGYGSTGYGYYWKTSEAEKNLLRTHTTAVSSRMLYRLAQTQKDGFKPAKYFSIDRVFRNEAIDRTHLAEFHQIEGVICDRGVTLGDLIGTLHLFFSRLGLPKLRFKPAYNPYTEPSMEIFSYSEELGKWMEVGNSGVFRPEMLRPMGLPEDVNVIAWGLSLERPTMILYGINNIRDLFGHKVSLSMVRKNPVCRLGL